MVVKPARLVALFIKMTGALANPIPHRFLAISIGSKLNSGAFYVAFQVLFVCFVSRDECSSHHWVGLAVAFRGSKCSCGVVQVQTQDQCDAANAFLAVANHAGDPVPTTIAYVAAINGYALLDWRTGETGGQAILKQDGAWKVVRGVGGAFDSAAMLMRFGVPAKTAQALWTQRSTDLGLAPAP